MSQEILFTSSLKAVAASGTRVFVDDQGEVHRDGGPAVIRTNGDLLWYRHGELHREDGPAKTGSIIDMTWFFNGKQISYHDDDDWETPIISTSNDILWVLLKANPEQITFFKSSTKEMQEYALSVRPDLAGKIKDLDHSLKEKYREELAIAGVEV